MTNDLKIFFSLFYIKNRKLYKYLKIIDMQLNELKKEVSL